MDSFSDQRGAVRCVDCEAGYHTDGVTGATSCGLQKAGPASRSSAESFNLASGSVLIFLGALLLCLFMCGCGGWRLYTLARSKYEAHADAREAADDIDQETESTGLMGDARIGNYEVTHRNGVAVFPDPQPGLLNGSGKGAHRASGFSAVPSLRPGSGYKDLSGHAEALSVKPRGELFEVVASKDDWLMLADGEGWVLGYDRSHGALVGRVVLDMEDGKLGSSSMHKKHSIQQIRSSIHSESPLQLHKTNQRQKGGVRASQFLAHPGHSLGLLYEATHKFSAGAGSAASRRGVTAPPTVDYRPEPALYYVDLQQSSFDEMSQDGEDPTVEASNSPDGLGSFLTTSLGSLFGAVAGKGRRQNAAPPPRPTKRNPHHKIATLSFGVEGAEESDARATANNNPRSSDAEQQAILNDMNSVHEPIWQTALLRGLRGSEDGRRYAGAASSSNEQSVIFSDDDDGVSASRPPQPLGVIPQLVSAHHFADASKCHYEVIYPKVRVRSSPSLRAAVLGYRKEGQIVEVVDENRHWVKIKRVNEVRMARKEAKELRHLERLYRKWGMGIPETPLDDEAGDEGGWILRYQKSFGPLLRMLEVEHWEQFEDPDHPNRFYFYNKATNESSWTDPRKRGDAPPPPAMPELLAGNSGSVGGHPDTDAYPSSASLHSFLGDASGSLSLPPPPGGAAEGPAPPMPPLPLGSVL